MELKNCPFCGGNNIESRTCDYGSKKFGKPYIVGCRDCHITTTIVPEAAKLKGFKSAKAASEYTWNQRAVGWIKFELGVDDEMEMFISPIPDDEQEILVTDGVTAWQDTFMNDGNECWLDGGHEIISDITHWMPLPPSPKRKG